MVIHCIFRDTSGLISLVVCVLYIYIRLYSKLCLRCEDLCSTDPCAEMLTHV